MTELAMEQGGLVLAQIQVSECAYADHGEIVVRLPKNWRKTPPTKNFAVETRESQRSTEASEDSDESPETFPLHLSLSYYLIAHNPSGKDYDTDDIFNALRDVCEDTLTQVIPDIIERIKGIEDLDDSTSPDYPALFHYDGLRFVYKGLVNLADVAMMVEALKLMATQKPAA